MRTDDSVDSPTTSFSNSEGERSTVGSSVDIVTSKTSIGARCDPEPYSAVQRMLDEVRIDSVYLAGQRPKERALEGYGRLAVLLDDVANAYSKKRT